MKSLVLAPLSGKGNVIQSRILHGLQDSIPEVIFYANIFFHIIFNVAINCFLGVKLVKEEPKEQIPRVRSYELRRSNW